MTVPSLNRLGSPHGTFTSDADLSVSFFEEPASRTALGIFLELPRFIVFKTAAPTALLAFVPLQDRWSRTRTGPRCVICLIPRHVATLAFLPPHHPAANT